MSWNPYTLVVDGSYFLHRTYHAIPYLSNRAGQPTNAIYGTVNALHKLIDNYAPQYMAVVFDSPEPCFRHKLSPLYKAHRPEYDIAMTSQVPYIHAIIQALGIPLVVRPGFEGDDIIGTLATIAADNGHSALICTGDKDMMQLVSPNIGIEDPFKNMRIGREQVYQKFNVYPEHIADLLALIGDSADGIRGVPGVGPKTAAGLIGQYGSLDNVIANLGEMKGRVSYLIQEGLENLKLDRVLTKIVTDLDLGLSMEHLKIQPTNIPELTKIYQELEFMQYNFAPRVNYEYT